ncbi:hypothetical protein IW261DRAFT_923188 [Armillaria novae-zelandiae]|uniref:Uncharacterized protein n=1 Tax=Armillaria novae-zelandiae TaxID=153914 RepID=A0AA39NRX0_9AGAR|nr:hypothetical protein IW261DRAFT_923188 [Armillaria novae-zelandiae]
MFLAANSDDPLSGASSPSRQMFRLVKHSPWPSLFPNDLALTMYTTASTPCCALPGNQVLLGNDVSCSGEQDCSVCRDVTYAPLLLCHPQYIFQQSSRHRPSPRKVHQAGDRLCAEMRYDWEEGRLCVDSNGRGCLRSPCFSFTLHPPHMFWRILLHMTHSRRLT